MANFEGDKVTDYHFSSLVQLFSIPVSPLCLAGLIYTPICLRGFHIFIQTETKWGINSQSDSFFYIVNPPSWQSLCNHPTWCWFKILSVGKTSIRTTPKMNSVLRVSWGLRPHSVVMVAEILSIKAPLMNECLNIFKPRHITLEESRHWEVHFWFLKMRRKI